MAMLLFGGLVCNDTERLSPLDIEMWARMFLRRAYPRGGPLQNVKMTIIVQGEPDGIEQPLGSLGNVTYFFSNAAVFQAAIEAQEANPAPEVSAKHFKQSHVAIGIGDTTFCAGHFAVCGIILPKEERGLIVDLIEGLDDTPEWSAVWANTEHPDELFRHNLMADVLKED